jgi:hypothetical protein
VNARVTCVWQPKHGNAREEYEDALYPTRSGTRSGRVLRIAVSDGATESSFSRLWARQLADAYGHGTLTPPLWQSSLSPLRAAWNDAVSTLKLSWYAEEKLRAGAYAALVGLTLRDGMFGEDVAWEAIAVGDCCLFTVRDDTLEHAFPLSKSDEFGSSPHLLGSRQRHGRALDESPLEASGRWRAGDVFYLASDAVAQWFLRRHEEGGRPWRTLDTFSGPRGRRRFSAWLEGERRCARIRNDDSTLIRLALE